LPFRPPTTCLDDVLYVHQRGGESCLVTRADSEMDIPWATFPLLQPSPSPRREARAPACVEPIGTHPPQPGCERFKSPLSHRLTDDSIKPPSIRYTFELVLARVFEGEPGAGNQILHGLRDEHL